LLLDDSDGKNASFLTQNFTAVPTFRIYLINPTQTSMTGLERSACAVEAVPGGALTKTNLTITETNRISNADGSAGTLTLPGDLSLFRVGQRRQVVISGLSRGTSYQVAFVSDVLTQANAEVLYMTTAFKTKKSDNCMLITDLTFCQEVAYSVPVTSQATLTTGLTPDAVKALYDEYAQSQMGSFENVLGRYDCSKSQYSLIRNCTDCTRSYKRWLCAVSIPRCTDVDDVKDSKNIGYVAPENMPKPDENPYLLDRSQGPVVVPRDANTTRSGVPPLNSTLIQPGDYAEVLPCIDLCFDVVQSCPNFLGFNCPVKNMYGNYGRNTKDGFQCNGLNLVPQASSATMSRAWTMMQVVAMAVVAMFVVL
jgi:calcium channel MID1